MTKWETSKYREPTHNTGCSYKLVHTARFLSRGYRHETASFTAHWSYNKFILMNLLRFPQSFCCSDREWCLWRNLIEQFLHYRAKNILLRLNSLLFLTGISNSQHSNSLSLWELSERGICSQIMIASTLEEFNELVRLRFLADSLHVSQEKEAIE